MVRQVPNGRQVPSLTSRDMFHLDGLHVSMGCQVPNSRQVPSWTPHNTVCPNGRHVLIGY